MHGAYLDWVNHPFWYIIFIVETKNEAHRQHTVSIKDVYCNWKLGTSLRWAKQRRLCKSPHFTCDAMLEQTTKSDDVIRLCFSHCVFHVIIDGFDVDRSNMCCYFSVCRLSVERTIRIVLADAKYKSKFVVFFMPSIPLRRTYHWIRSRWVFFLFSSVVFFSESMLLCAFHMHLTAQQCTNHSPKNWIFCLHTRRLKRCRPSIIRRK